MSGNRSLEIALRNMRNEAFIQAARAAANAADEWWLNLKARDRGEKLPELGSISDYMITAIQKLCK